jgi:hypothetical protein
LLIEQLLLALIVFITATLTTMIGWYGSKKFHVGPAQEQLVKTLQGVVEAQQIRIKQLEDMTIGDTKRIVELEARVKELERVILDQSQMLSRLKDMLDKEDNE